MRTKFLEAEGVFSPNGRWIAYTTDEIGEPNVFVQSFPEANEKHRVSTNGGNHPVWRADGKELFYLGADARMMAVPIDTTGGFAPGVPHALFPTDALSTSFSTGQVYFNTGQVYAVTKDGQRFLVNERVPHSSGVAPLTVVVNWTAAIQK